MKTKKQSILVLILLGGLFLAGVVRAAPPATLERYVIGSGGGHTEAGSYTLDGTIGQAVVGVDIASPFELCSGFWCGLDAEDTSHIFYLPIIMKQSL